MFKLMKGAQVAIIACVIYKIFQDALEIGIFQADYSLFLLSLLDWLALGWLLGQEASSVEYLLGVLCLTPRLAEVVI